VLIRNFARRSPADNQRTISGQKGDIEGGWKGSRSGQIDWAPPARCGQERGQPSDKLRGTPPLPLGLSAPTPGAVRWGVWIQVSASEFQDSWGRNDPAVGTTAV